MKIAIVRQRYTHFGGAERFVARALNALAGQGVAVTLITRKWQDDASNQPARTCNPFFIGRLWRDWGFARGVQGIIAAGEFELVQSHERIPGCAVFRAGDGVHASWLEIRGKSQTALQRWATRLSPWHRYTLAAEKAMFSHPALRAVICNSHMVRGEIMARYGVAEARIHVIHNGVDLQHFTPALRNEHRVAMRGALRIPEDAPLVLFVGSGFERKGLPQLLQSFARMLRDDAWLVVVGKDRKQGQMQKLAADLGISGRVHFAGGQQDVRPWYGMADVLALPTLYDPFPNVVLEALACGLPVLTSTHSGGAELIAGASCGRVCEHEDLDAQAVALDQLIRDNGATQSDTARNIVAHLGQEDLAARLGALYAALLKP